MTRDADTAPPPAPPTSPANALQEPGLPDTAAADRAQVEAWLTGFLDRRALPTVLDDAVRYALFGPGKRVRPLLCLACCRAVGGRTELALPAAGCVELIHAFSLVHDDLPALDNDDLRRGRPTLHVHAGEDTAILAGDALLSLAVEAVAEPNPGLAPAVAAQLVSEAARATTDMIAGQGYDTLPHAGRPAPDAPRDERLAWLERMHGLKTGALLIAACRMGAIVGGANPGHLDAVTRFAQTAGLLFQVVDDLLDCTATSQELGKAAGKDHDAGKLTYPGLLGVKGARAVAEELSQQAGQAAAELDASEPGDTGESTRTGGAELDLWRRFVAERRR